LDPIFERRCADIEGAEIREEGGRLAFRGHAAVFGALTDLGLNRPGFGGGSNL
jgi:hypothetical protein